MANGITASFYVGNELLTINNIAGVAGNRKEIAMFSLPFEALLMVKAAVSVID